jgi:hypothetical protein
MDEKRKAYLYKTRERIRELQRLRQKRYRKKRGSIKNLQFHHTDYKLNKGITLCSICHYKTHHLN